MSESTNRFFTNQLNELKSSKFWKAVLVECLGTLLLVFIGCASCVQNNLCSTKKVAEAADVTTVSPHSCKDADPNNATILQIALTFGLAVASIVWIIAHISGGHINPAVTVAMFSTRKITAVRFGFYVAAQVVGAIIGAAMVKGVNPAHLKGELCPNTVAEGVSDGQAFLVEFMITLILVLTVFAACDTERMDLAGSAPLAIGLSITLCHLAAIKYTGSSMNPARSFGPAAILNNWDSQWIYWVGPMSGGVVAGLLYDLLLASNASVDKAKAFWSPVNHDHQPYDQFHIRESDAYEQPPRGE